MRFWQCMAAATVLTLAFGSIARADVIDINFDTLADHDFVNDYYAGGSTQSGQTGGPDYGITFANAIVLNEYTENEGELVSAPNSITFLDGIGSVMNVAGGFTTGFSFNYSTPYYEGIVTVWSGLNATGTQLASITLPTTPDTNGGDPGCGGHNFCPDLPAGVTFNGVAMSVNFSGTANFVVYDDITLGSSVVGPAGGGTTGVPEPITLALFGAGLAGIAGVRRRRKSS